MAQAWTVVVTTEPEWDDATFGKIEGLAHYDDDCCPGCGLHQSILDDPDAHKFQLVDKVCEVCAGRDIHQRVLGERDQEFEEKRNLAAKTRRPSDGRTTRLREVSPLEQALSAAAKQQNAEHDD